MDVGYLRSMLVYNVNGFVSQGATLFNDEVWIRHGREKKNKLRTVRTFAIREQNKRARGCLGRGGPQVQKKREREEFFCIPLFNVKPHLYIS